MAVPTTPPERRKIEMRVRRWSRTWVLAVGMATAPAVVFGLMTEARTSWLQSELLSRSARSLTFEVQPGPSETIRYPSAGPYDERLGYVELPAFIERLRAQRFTVERQARLSPRHQAAIDRGAFPIYAEKTAAGLHVLDRSGAEVFSARFPERTYVGFGAVPRLVVETLLFIENRELLDGDSPRRNPAIEWDRLAAVLRDSVVKLVDPGLNLPGGSTLATQIEKYRHAPAGRTEDATAKLRQMVSASLRAYRNGPDTSRGAPAAGGRLSQLDAAQRPHRLRRGERAGRRAVGVVRHRFRAGRSGAARAGWVCRHAGAGADLQAGAGTPARATPAVLLSDRRAARHCAASPIPISACSARRA